MRSTMILLTLLAFYVSMTMCQLNSQQQRQLQQAMNTLNTSSSNSSTKQQKLTSQQKELVQEALQRAMEGKTNSQLTSQQQQLLQSALNDPSNNQLTPQQKQLVQQSMQQVFSSSESMSTAHNETSRSEQHEQDEQHSNKDQIEEMLDFFEHMGIPMGEEGPEPDELDAHDFKSRSQLEDLLNNMTASIKRLGLETNQTKLDEYKQQYLQAFDYQVQNQLQHVQNAQTNLQNLYGQNPPPPQFQKLQQQLSKFQKEGDTEGLEDAEERLTEASSQAERLSEMQEQMRQNMEHFNQEMQGMGNNPNPSEVMNAMSQFTERQGQLSGEYFRQVVQQLQQTNMFGQVNNTDDAEDMLATLAQMSYQQGQVDILAQTTINDTEGVKKAQKQMDQMRRSGQQRYAQLMQQGGQTSQFIPSASMYFQNFKPTNNNNGMNVTAGQGQPSMNLPPQFMQNALKGLSDVVAQISSQDSGEWDSIDEIASYVQSKIVDIKFFSGTDQVNVTGLSGSEKFTFCAPLEVTTVTDCSGFICAYIDPASQTLKFDGVTLVSDALSQLSDGSPCCSCQAAHTTSFAVVSASANAAKLIMSLFGLLLAIFALFFA